MKSLTLKLSIVLLIITILLPYVASMDSQEDMASIIVGYSKSYMFPLLDGGRLYFEKGEELWAMTLDKPAVLTLTSPTGIATQYYLEPFKQTLIKLFTEDDEEGQWILSSESYSLTIELSSKKKLEDGTRLNYRISREKLTIETANKDQDVFIIDVEDGGFLTPARIEVDINLPNLRGENEQIYASVVMDLVYPGEFSYSGKLFDRPYSITMEPLAARIIGKLRRDTLTLVIPGLHEVGAGGVIPVREGEALLKIRYVSAEQDKFSLKTLNYTSRLEQVKVYIVDGIFNEWAGRSVAKSFSIDIEDALNKTIRVIARSGGGVTISYALIPLASIIFYEPRLNKIIENISMIVEGHQATIVNGRGYILLSDSESALPILVSEDSTELQLHAFINNFKIYDGKVKVSRGETYFIPIELRSLKVNIFFPNGTPVYGGVLRVNGSRMDIINGSASYLLPVGRYLIEFNSNEWFGRATIDLLEDTTLRINLTRYPRILDALKTIAGLESITLTFLSFLVIRLRRIKSHMRLKRYDYLFHNPKDMNNSI
jgi:hypothetical protein